MTANPLLTSLIIHNADQPMYASQKPPVYAFPMSPRPSFLLRIKLRLITVTKTSVFKMAKGDPDQSTFTLRFKHGKHTIFLFAEPNTPFPSIISELLKTLHERYPNGLPVSTSPGSFKIPDDVLEVTLGVPADQHDISKGWTELDTGAQGGLKETPRSLGLKDGGMVAFAFDGDEDKRTEFHVEFSDESQLYPEEE